MSDNFLLVRATFAETRPAQNSAPNFDLSNTHAPLRLMSYIAQNQLNRLG